MIREVTLQYYHQNKLQSIIINCFILSNITIGVGSPQKYPPESEKNENQSHILKPEDNPDFCATDEKHDGNVINENVKQSVSVVENEEQSEQAIPVRRKRGRPPRNAPRIEGEATPAKRRPGRPRRETLEPLKNNAIPNSTEVGIFPLYHYPS